MSLRDWLKNGWLVEHQTSRQEIANLLALVDRDLADPQTPASSPDWRFNIAYNAALQAATAALAVAGYRAAREAHHYRTIQSLTYTMGIDAKTVAQLDRFRKKRNVGGYEQAGTISDQEAKEITMLAKKLREQVQTWIRASHSEFL